MNMTVLTLQNKCEWSSFLIQESIHVDILFSDSVWLEEMIWREATLVQLSK